MSLIKEVPRLAAKYAVACPGQGYIRPQGYLTPYKQYKKEISPILEEIDESLGFKFTDHLFEENPDTNNVFFRHTSNAQPAIVATTYVIHQLYEQIYGVNLAKGASFLLGHSLGEYSALLLKGSLTFSQVLQLVRKRGELMEKMFPSEEYGMYAVNLRPANFEKVLEIVKGLGVLANINGKFQLTLLGPLDSVEESIKDLTNQKLIIKGVKLPVTIPFHSSVLAPIESHLLDLVNLFPKFPEALPDPPYIVSNLAGHTLGPDTLTEIGSTIAANLKPVQWLASLENLLRDGVTQVLCLGPGKPVHGLVLKSGLFETFYVDADA